VLIEAKFILAEAAADKLRKLIEDNRAGRRICLSVPSMTAFTTRRSISTCTRISSWGPTSMRRRAPWGAVNVYRLAGDDADAMESARDLTTLYAGTPYAQMAKDYLDKLPTI